MAPKKGSKKKKKGDYTVQRQRNNDSVKKCRQRKREEMEVIKQKKEKLEEELSEKKARSKDLDNSIEHLQNLLQVHETVPNPQ